MKRKLEITPEAERDLTVIAADIQRHNGIASAKQALSELKNQLNILSELQISSRDGGHDGIREAVMTGLPYISFYKTSDKLFTLLRVLYGGTDRRKSKR